MILSCTTNVRMAFELPLLLENSAMVTNMIFLSVRKSVIPWLPIRHKRTYYLEYEL